MTKYRAWISLGLLTASIGFGAQAHAQSLIENTDASITYEGSWQTIANPNVSGGTLTVSNQPGASATIAFNGPLRWIGYGCPCAGIARMYLDGAEFRTRDAYDDTHDAQQLMYAFDNLSAGPHTLKIEVTGQRNVRSNDYYVGIDAFVVGRDTIPPTVTLTSPADGAVVTGQVVLSAEASDNIGMSRVSFTAINSRGSTIRLGEDRLPPYSITVDTSRIPHATSFTVQAYVSDLSGNEARSSARVTVYQGGVTDVTPPFIEMSAPANDSIVSGLVTISAEGHDNVGITKVEFIAGDNTIIGVDTSAPYSIERDTSNLPNGSTYYLRARAYDAAGLSSTSSYSRKVTVQH